MPSLYTTNNNNNTKTKTQEHYMSQRYSTGMNTRHNKFRNSLYLTKTQNKLHYNSYSSQKVIYMFPAHGKGGFGFLSVHKR